MGGKEEEGQEARRGCRLEAASFAVLREIEFHLVRCLSEILEVGTGIIRPQMAGAGIGQEEEGFLLRHDGKDRARDDSWSRLV